MTKKFNLSEAAADILGGNIASKQGGQDSFGLGKSLNPAAVLQGHGVELNATAHTNTKDALPDGTKGVPTATAPGKTGVGKQTDGVGATKVKGPQDTEGRSDLDSEEGDEDSYETIRDRKQGKKPTQTMQMNPGVTMQQYEETDVDAEDSYITEEDFEYDASEDVDALLSGESLSEEFKTRAVTIFEAAVTSRAMTIVEKIEAKMQEKFEEEVDLVKEELADKLDNYLNYMVQEWMEENKLAIEKGLRAEVVESFIGGLKDLFVEHYIDIPEEKVDIVGELADKVIELEEEINEQLNRNVNLNKELSEHKKVEAIYTVCEGLTQTQVEKIVSLAESLQYTTQTEFTNKLEAIKESYFPSSIKVATSSEFLEESFEEEEPKQTTKAVDSEMAIYAKTISKTVNK